MSEIDPHRLMNDLRHLRTIGQYGTGVVRPAFSTKDMAARQWLVDRMDEAGLKASMDGMGNVFGRFRNPGGEGPAMTEVFTFMMLSFV